MTITEAKTRIANYEERAQKSYEKSPKVWNGREVERCLEAWGKWGGKADALRAEFCL